MAPLAPLLLGDFEPKIFFEEFFVFQAHLLRFFLPRFIFENIISFALSTNNGRRLLVRAGVVDEVLVRGEELLEDVLILS